jgi:hypothetical protein
MVVHSKERGIRLAAAVSRSNHSREEFIERGPAIYS